MLGWAGSCRILVLGAADGKKGPIEKAAFLEEKKSKVSKYERKLYGSAKNKCVRGLANNSRRNKVAICKYR